MKNFKLNKNRGPLSDEDIAAGKNFEPVLQSYYVVRSPFFKSFKFWGFSASVLVVATVLVMLHLKNVAVNTGTGAFINPPIAAINVPYESFELSAGHDSVVITKEGSIIHVPANAFRDKNGNIIQGKVQLKYREFHELSEVFMAGVPMNYDSAGVHYNFETAGMMEISASCNGLPAQTNPEALINVNMVSYDSADRFNTYYLDTVARKWVYIAQPNLAPVSAGNRLLDSVAQSAQGPTFAHNTAETELAALTKQKPIAPKKQNPDRPKFKITADSADFPELAMYTGLKFQVVDLAHYKPEKGDVVWDNVQLMRAPNGRYKITFKRPGETYVVIAEPVIDDKDFASAQKIYAEKQKAYETKLAEKKALVEKQLAEKKQAQKTEQAERAAGEKQAKNYRIAAQRAAALRERDSLNTVLAADRAGMADLRRQAREKMSADLANAKDREMNQRQQALVFRSFAVADFGYWNGDHPCNLPHPCADVIARFVDSKSGQPLNIDAADLVAQGRKLIYTNNPYLGDGLRLRFDINENNMVLAATADGKLAIAQAGNFKKQVGDGTGEKTIALEVLDKKFENEEEVKKYFSI